MKQIVVVCGMGLGSSFYVELNIRDILEKYGVQNEYEVSHQALYEADWGMADYIVIGRDLEGSVPADKTRIILENIIDQDELEQKVVQTLSL